MAIPHIDLSSRFTDTSCSHLGPSAGDCVAPLQKDIPNSAILTCEEGSRPTMQCTARCKETYYPVPASLDCQGAEARP